MDKYEKIIGLAKRRGFLWNSFELYGGTAGFYDYGPLGAMLKRRIEDIWRKMYVIEEGFYEIETPTIGIAAIFDASGHTRGFSDPMVVCSGCDHAFRADHLIEGIVETPDALPASEIKRLIDEHGIKCPQCGGVGTFGDVSSFNLMFKTTIGPGTERVGYLRPETAQGMFVDFEHLFRFYREKLPFGVTQIGKAYRNEISPRQGVIRLREFTQAEAEIFINPTDKNHPGFSMIEDTVLRYYPASHQRVSHPAHEDDGGIIELTAKDAVDQAIVAHEFLAYHLVLTHHFLVRVGVDPARMRFRQHQPDEMAHYAVDCWDAEVLTDRFGWVEIVGIADRSDYDLSSHAEHSKKDLSVLIEYDTPKQAERITVNPDMSVIGPLFKDKASDILAELKEPIKKGFDGDKIKIEIDLAALKAAELKGSKKIEIDLATLKKSKEKEIRSAELKGSKKIEIDLATLKKSKEKEIRSAELKGSKKIEIDLATLKKSKIEEVGERVIPHVIEPSFGIDRIIYAALEHSFSEELVEGETRNVLHLPAEVAPVQVAVLPLLTREELIAPALAIVKTLRENGVFVSYDDSGTIGRRYRRNDEIGTPFSITIDYKTLDDDTVTIRDRDSMAQIRMPIGELAETLRAMIRDGFTKPVQ